VLVIGASVLRARVLAASKHHHHDGHDHHHDDPHTHSHSHSHTHDDGITWKGIIAMGASAGLLPCPSALVVLLGAIAQHQVALGLLMIVVFSLGLACTLTTLGIAVVSAGRVTARLSLSGHGMAGRVTTALPALSALVILVAGVVLTAKAVPHLS
jgi:ABC-type nickel/cobalt efflux system permease component RcnA